MLPKFLLSKQMHSEGSILCHIARFFYFSSRFLFIVRTLLLRISETAFYTAADWKNDRNGSPLPRLCSFTFWFFSSFHEEMEFTSPPIEFFDLWLFAKWWQPENKEVPILDFGRPFPPPFLLLEPYSVVIWTDLVWLSRRKRPHGAEISHPPSVTEQPTSAVST